MKANYMLFLWIMVLMATVAFAPPLPSVGVSVEYPVGDLDVNQDHFFEVITNVSCAGSDCGDIDVYLDPYPPQCSNYTPIDWDGNSIYEPYTTGECTSGLTPGWYRLTGTYDAIPVQRSYTTLICNTHAPGFLNFTYPTSPAETTSGNICYHWSGSTCNWWSTGIQVTNCAGYYVYYLTPSPVCTLHPCTTDEIPPPDQDKTGLVSETYGTVPFYTNGSNPQTVNLDVGQSQLVNFWVNATGGVWNYTFFAYANLSSTPSVNDQTVDWTVSVYPPPTPSFVDLPTYVQSSGADVDVDIEISADYFFGTIESPTLDSIWWNDGADDYPYNGPVSHSFPVGIHTLTAYANDTEGNVYSSQETLKVGAVECGDVLDTDVIMNTDLDCSGYSADALTIDTNGVELDCNGHTITGPGDFIGVNLDHVDGVTVRDCTIVDFNDGIFMDNTDNSQILDNTLAHNYYGLDLYYSDLNLVQSNDFESNEYGFYLYYSDNNEIKYNHVTETDSANFGSGSCPFLYLWNGSEYEYYTDLAGESLGGSWFETPLYEAGIYELGDFKPEDGYYKLKVREVIPESDFFDEAKLVIVDAPEGYGVLNQWHNTYSDDEAPPKEFMTIKDPRVPVSATDKYGNDVLDEISGKDGVPLKTHEKEPNYVVVDFGSIDNPEYAKLVITGWSAYQFNPDVPSQKNLVVETLDDEGQWVLAKSFGKFTGDSRTFVFDISGILKEDDTRMRISAPSSKTVLNVMDQVLLDDSAPVGFELTYVEPDYADLQWGGAATYTYATEEHRHIVSNDQLPNVEEYLMYGNFTRYGDVLPLLDDTDDMFAIMRHGDEIEMGFPEIAPKEGMDRHVFLLADVMYTIRYSVKDEVSDSIDPMPFHGMSEYPYGAGESYPDDEEHSQYQSEWNTRAYEKPDRYGGSLPWSFNNTVLRNTFTGGQYSTALYLEHEDSTSVLYNRMSGVMVGIDLYSSVNSLIQGNDVSAEGGRALMLRGNSNDNTVRDNVLVSDNSEECDYSECGALFIGRSYDNLIDGNDLSGIDSYGAYVGRSEDNWISNNSIQSSGGYEAVYLTKEATGNTILHNTLRSDIWIYDDEGGNDFSDSYSGNRYYAADGTGAWEMFNISDTDNDGWADEGSDLPFNCDTVGDCDALGYTYWGGDGEDYHPATRPEPTPPSDENDDGNKKRMSIGLDSSCEENVVTVSSGGSGVSGVRVYVSDSGNEVVLGTTDGDGELSFQGCGMDIDVHASKSGYLAEDAEFSLIDCASCAGELPPEPECGSDSECLDEEQCSDSMCVPVSCGCGIVQDHACVEYECCSDSDCESGEVCADNSCQEKQPEPECLSDDDCASGEECLGQECVEKAAPPEVDPAEEEALDEIHKAQDAVGGSRSEGKDTGEAEAMLKKAQDAFEEGRFGEAKDLAMQARDLALKATAPPPPEEEAPEQAPEAGFDPVWIIAGVLILAIGAIIWFTARPKK